MPTPTLAELKATIIALEKEREAARNRTITARQDLANTANVANQTVAKAVAAEKELAVVQGKLEEM